MKFQKCLYIVSLSVVIFLFNVLIGLSLLHNMLLVVMSMALSLFLCMFKRKLKKSITPVVLVVNLVLLLSYHKFYLHEMPSYLYSFSGLVLFICIIDRLDKREKDLSYHESI
ncbi:hypothetical protein EZV73_13585 [Acidaminobacter sp. JC074]|uniref:hypothetical protein n=1 Tax=Acidaminobacter sp. JC074 TaxID=2530199 RepID=UPI001F0CEBF3|nr:hypothetical protein [Acidaminobacter sp. JC074]MCH4888619.1 hypothetical protein [Acidaminobacter sp. JC074]